MSTRFAEPLSTMMSGLVITEKARTGSATSLAARSGAEMPRNCGSSSPNSIEKRVAMTRAMAVAVGGTDDDGIPMAVSGVRSNLPSDGWAR